MTQSGLFDDANPTRATLDLHIAWNNGPFDSATVNLVCHVGSRLVFEHHQAASDQEMDFSEVFHVAAREAQRLVLGHRVTNSHIRRGRVVYSALTEADIFDSANND